MNQEKELINKKGEKKTSDKVAAVAGMIVLAIVVIFAVAFIAGLVVSWLWNRLMPGIFSLPAITYWQAMGLFILAQLFFGSGSRIVSGNKASTKLSGRSNQIDNQVAVERVDEDGYEDWWRREGKQAFEAYKKSAYVADKYDSDN